MKFKVTKKIGMKFLNKLNSFTENYEAIITKKDIEITLSHQTVISKFIEKIQGTVLEKTLKLNGIEIGELK